MKLGLNIEITSQGAGSAAKIINPTQELAKYASASRSIIKEVFPAREDLRQRGLNVTHSLDESERSVIFLRFLGAAGYLICIFQARPENSGRPYDGAAAWIYVPATVRLSGVEAEKLIREVETALLNARGIDYQRLESIFSTDYQERDVIPAIKYIVSNGGSSAVRYYGQGTGYQLNELLGDGIAQLEYGKHKAIFFLKKSDNIYFSGKELTSPILFTCVIEPPVSTCGFTPYFEDGSNFDRPIEVSVDADIKMIWRKNGCQDIRKVVKARTMDVALSSKLFGFADDDIKFAVSKKWFYVHCKSMQLHNYKIQIDDQDLNDVIYIPESKKATGVRVTVSADGYTTYKNDLFLSSHNIDIPMSRVIHHYEFLIPAYNGKEQIKDALVKVQAKERLKGSPIKGYSLSDYSLYEGEGGGNILKHNPLSGIKYFAYGFITCFLLILFAVLGIMFFDGDFPSKKVAEMENVNSCIGGESTGSTPDQEQLSDVEKDLRNAITYLDNNDVWNKNELDKFNATKGLFDALNNLDMGALQDEWAKKLDGSSKFQEIAEKAKDAIKHKRRIDLADRDGRYNRNVDDFSINVENYKKFISEDHYPKPSGVNTATGSNPNGGSGAQSVKGTAAASEKSSENKIRGNINENNN